MPESIQVWAVRGPMGFQDLNSFLWDLGWGTITEEQGNHRQNYTSLFLGLVQYSVSLKGGTSKLENTAYSICLVEPTYPASCTDYSSLSKGQSSRSLLRHGSGDWVFGQASSLLRHRKLPSSPISKMWPKNVLGSIQTVECLFFFCGELCRG